LEQHIAMCRFQIQQFPNDWFVHLQSRCCKDQEITKQFYSLDFCKGAKIEKELRISTYLKTFS
jgi:hypothetical protein